ncbi:MAG: indolepyruvate ferredoxin oxidoreductase subunit alpha [Clostridia bacterium]
MDKKMMLGNAAVARGLYEAGCRFVSSYPGTPSTEITESVAQYDEIHAEWAPNEKVAVEATMGASIGGGRAFSAMKHVGLNVAADPLFTASYTGVRAGAVIAVADDMGMHSSQNEQDSRHYARASKMPMLEPSDSQECKDFAVLAFELSERFDTPVYLRLSTRVSHSQSAVTIGKRTEVALKPYEKDISKYVMMPAKAKLRHFVVEQRELDLREYAENCDINKTIMGGTKIGIIASGIAYQYAREAFGDDASYLKLGMVYPLPVKLIENFAKSVDKLYVIEELDDVFEAHCLKHGIKVEGKALFSKIDEYTPEMLRHKILGTPLPSKNSEATPPRPPVLCPGCPHRGLFYVLHKLGLVVSGDIGCYTLGAQPPLNAVDTTLCMGASISGLHGMNMVNDPEFAKKSVAVIGDSTFIHSGITGLIDIVYNQSPSTVVILDNSITGMTGHQQNPSTGLTLKNRPAPMLDLEAVCRAVGVARVVVVDPNDMAASEAAIREELLAPEPSVVIARRPCALLKYVKHEKPMKVIADKCIGCKMCIKIGCPAISMVDGHAVIDESLCVGCGLCADMCKLGCIERGEA